MIEDYIPVGHDRAISRRSLALALGMTDRDTRRAIQTAREGGALILNDQDGAGYYTTDDPAALRRQIEQNMSRIRSISRQTKYLRLKLKEIES